MSAGHEGQMARAIREVLVAFVAPNLVDDIITTALQLGCETHVPEEADRARYFVEGPLRRTITHIVGGNVADAAVEFLNPILEMAGSRVLVKVENALAERRAADPSTRTTDKTRAPRNVLMVSNNQGGVRRVASRLGGQASVHHVNDMFAFMTAIDAAQSSKPVVIIDCVVPAVDERGLGTTMPLLPKGTRVILWGAPETLRRHLSTMCGGMDQWVTVEAEASADDIGALVGTLLN